MKNISRRVFIKGMAVAAVATAASTVLAGCNVPGVTEEAPVTGFASQTKTMTLEDDVTLTLTTTSSTVTADDKIKVGVTLVNESEKGIHFWNNKTGTPGTQNVHVKAYFDGKYIDSEAPVTGGDKSMWYGDNTTPYAANNTPSTGLSSTYTHKGYFYFDEPKEWSTMTLVFTVDDYTNVKGDTVTKELQFTINK